MDASLISVLNERLAELGVKDTHRARAEYLGTDPGTFSKLLSGAMPLTKDRANAWAMRACENPDDALGFAARLLAVAQATAPVPTVHQFCDRVVAEGGAVSAERISELFEALRHVERVLVCCEYRDLPRAGPAAKYEELGRTLGAAIANGIHFAMFQPFGCDIPFPSPQKNAQAFDAASYMLKIQRSCRSAHAKFRRAALAELETKPENEGAKLEDLEKVIDSHLCLYERKEQAVYLGSGLQAKLFYIQFDTKEGANITIRHHRIFQWVSTPTRDLLIYRGEIHLDPDAVRDTFFPIPHYFDFDLNHGLPVSFGEDFEKCLVELKEQFDLPNEHMWQVGCHA